MEKVQRLWEIDSLRGIAITMMLLSNFLFDLYFFSGCSNCYSGFWLYFARATASLFILVAGISVTLSYSRVREKTGRHLSKFLKRGARILFYGLLITAVTWIFLPGGFIVFGILHLIGLAIILSYPFLRMKFLNLFLGAVFILLGFLIENILASFPWLIWLGLKFPGFYSVDYVPLFPWFGVFLLGIFLGNFLFPNGKPRLKISDFSASPIIKIITFLGRNSLRLYLIHQPVFISVVYLFFL